MDFQRVTRNASKMKVSEAKDKPKHDKTKRCSVTRIFDSPNLKRQVLGEVTNAFDDTVAVDCKGKNATKAGNLIKPPESTLDNSSDSVPFMTPEVDIKESGKLPPGVEDFDKECMDNLQAYACYAAHIFEYLKEREVLYIVPDYMNNQKEVTKLMRSVVVDWMVDVQESFELNHESLYLAVKTMDIFLSKKQVSKDTVQLVAVTSIFIAAKYDERCMPALDDFLYVCDDAYTRPQLLLMEQTILKAIGFDLGAPLSYTFLRRYSRCSKQPMATLTLARYILELSLVEYEFVNELDSMMAAAALSLALRMKGQEPWSPTLKYYSGYEWWELLAVVRKLNRVVVTAHSKQTKTIVLKYSHTVFHEVAKIPPIQI